MAGVGAFRRHEEKMKPKSPYLKFLCATILTGLVMATRAFAADDGPRQHLCLDLNWLFIKGDPADAGQPGFDDRAWRAIGVPHDWSIEGPYAETNSTAG